MSDQYSHAITYAPSTVPPGRNWDIEILKAHGIRYIRFQLVDPTNNVRYRVIPISHFERMLRGSSRPSLSFAKVILGTVFLEPAEGFTPHGEYIYIPDMSTVRILPYKPGHASVLGWFEEKVPISGPDETWITKVDFCPRGILHKVIE
jgi:glutamine synthetase